MLRKVANMRVRLKEERKMQFSKGFYTVSCNICIKKRRMDLMNGLFSGSKVGWLTRLKG